MDEIFQCSDRAWWLFSCAVILELHKIIVAVFKRESTFSSGGKGSSLDIYLETGQHALETGQLTSQLRKVACRLAGPRGAGKSYENHGQAW